MFQYLNKKFGVTRSILNAHREELNRHFLPWKMDKGAHIIGFFLTFSMLCGFKIGAGWALIITGVLAAAKEVYDYYHVNHDADFWDFVASVTIPTLTYLLFFI